MDFIPLILQMALYASKKKYVFGMMKQLRYVTGKSNFNIIYFLAIFFILYYGFYFFVGLSTPGGKIFIPFLYQYVNIPNWLSIIVVKFTMLLLKIAGYNVYQKSPENVTIIGGTGANIIWGCIGIGVMVLWFAFIMAHKAQLIYKLKWIIAGVIIIYFFNAVRIAAILLSYKYKWSYLKSFNAHSTFNNITYLIILALMFFFVRNYNRREKKQINRKE